MFYPEGVVDILYEVSIANTITIGSNHDKGLSQPLCDKRLLPLLKQVIQEEIRDKRLCINCHIYCLIDNLQDTILCNTTNHRYRHGYLWLSILQASIIIPDIPQVAAIDYWIFGSCYLNDV